MLTSRQLDCFIEGRTFVSTVEVHDHPPTKFETAVAHPEYNDGSLIIVQEYMTEEQALAGHKRWVKIMTSNELPEQIEDVSSAIAAVGCDICEDENWRIYNRVIASDNLN